MLPSSAEVEECSISQTLSSTNNLQTPVLINYNNPPFILALDPEVNLSNSNIALCFKLEKLVLYIRHDDAFRVTYLISMTKN